MASYFSYFPEMEYVSRTTDRSSSDETIRVKNIFKRPKLRNDFANVATAFSDYMIVGDERPDQTAEAVYGDPRFDWVILTTNNITNYRDQWPLNDADFQIYILEKYGSEAALEEVHHYNTELFMDQSGRLIVPEGLRVDSNFNSRYLDEVLQTEITIAGEDLNPLASVDNVGVARDANGDQILCNNVFPVTNYQYEVNENDAKRRIRILKGDYLGIYVSDMRRIMKYKPSTDYLNRRLKKVYNPRLSGS